MNQQAPIAPESFKLEAAQEPGVYVRSTEPAEELDYLWNRDRYAKAHDHDKFHLGFFLLGSALGLFLGIAGTYTLMSKAQTPLTNQWTSPPPTKTTIIEEQLVTPNDLDPSKAKPQVKTQPEKAKSVIPFAEHFTKKPEPTAHESVPVDEAPVTTTTASKSYTIQSGDTLSGIAYKTYKSNDPKWIEAIQKANNMASPHDLKLGQTIILPNKP